MRLETEDENSGAVVRSKHWIDMGKVALLMVFAPWLILFGVAYYGNMYRYEDFLFYLFGFNLLFLPGLVLALSLIALSRNERNVYAWLALIIMVLFCLNEFLVNPGMMFRLMPPGFLTFE